MRRLLAAAAVLLALVLVGCGSPHQPTPHHGLWVTPAPKHTPTQTAPRHVGRISYSLSSDPCGSVDCGPYAAALRWSLAAWGHATSGYFLTVNGTQFADVPTSPWVVGGLDCGTTFTLGVQAHDGTGDTGPLYTSGYTTPACPVQGFDDEFSSSSVDTTQWSVIDNTLGNTSTVQCDFASNTTEASGNLVETEAAGSYSCQGPTGGNGGISSCPSGTCSTTTASGAVTTRDFAFKWGTVEVRAKMSGGSGTNGAWPAFWMLGLDCQHPAFLTASGDPPNCSWHSPGSEEIDVAEVKDWDTSGPQDAGVWSNMFTGATPVCKPTAGGALPAGFSASGAFHTYKMVWTSSAATFYVDGTQTCQFTSSLPSTPMFVLLVNEMRSTTQPTNKLAQFDYVRVNVNGPYETALPSISGSLTHGSVLTASNGTWTGSPTGFTYQWLQCGSSGLFCTPISGATSSTYTTTSGDIGHEIQVLVDATNASGVTQYGSTPTGQVT